MVVGFWDYLLSWFSRAYESDVFQADTWTQPQRCSPDRVYPQTKHVGKEAGGFIACGKVMRAAQRSTKVMVMKYDSLTGQIIVIATNPPVG